MVPDTKSDSVALAHMQTMCLTEVRNLLLAVGAGGGVVMVLGD